MSLVNLTLSVMYVVRRLKHTKHTIDGMVLLSVLMIMKFGMSRTL